MLKRFLLVFLMVCISGSVTGRENVLIGAYHFPPFVEGRKGEPIGGAIVDLVDAMNQIQSHYQFSITKTTPELRYADFNNGRFDLLMFENIEWGWDKRLVASSGSYLEGGERYIALRDKGRGQEYFDQLSNKTIIGIRGYHYGFANFNSDPDYLSGAFRINFSESNLGTIKMVLAGNRGDIAVVTQSFLNHYLSKHPKNRSRLLISKKLDQKYNHTILVRKGIKPTVSQINSYLIDISNTGVLTRIWKKYGIQ